MRSNQANRGRLQRCLLAVFVMLLLMFVLGVACAPSSPPPVPSAPTPSSPGHPSAPPVSPPELPAPTIKWSADGVIATGEYTGVKSYGDYEINWTDDEKYVYVGLKVKTTGWVALGIQPGSTMKDADIVLGFVKDGKTTVFDQFSTGSYGPHSLDTALGGNSDILEYGGKEDGGYTTIEFKRLLDTGDKYDQPLLKGVNQIIWAYGSDDTLELKHIIRGYGEIDL
jgi:hypothetical protein